MVQFNCDRLNDMRSGSPDTRGTRVEFTFNAQVVQAYAGESLAAALFAAGIHALRTSPRKNEPRGMFCLMGSCQECAVWINGRRSLACQEAVAAGLDVRSRDGTSP